MDYTIDVVTASGVPFRVVYGKRVWPSGHQHSYPTVAFYDRRYPDFSKYGGQFVGDYNSEDLADHDQGYGLALNGDDSSWTIDARTMRLVLRWLSSILVRSDV